MLTVAPTDASSDASSSPPSPKRKKRFKGFEGEIPEALSNMPQGSYITLIEGQHVLFRCSLEFFEVEHAFSEPSFGSFRTTHTTVSEIDGSATTHLTVKCTLLDIARATNLRPEDTAFAMEESGLLSRVRATNETDSEIIVISREMVEAVAAKRKVKPAVLDLAHVLL